MVRTENCVGYQTVRHSLSFETTEWRIAASDEVRERMAAILAGEFDSQPIDTDDVSDLNRRRLTIVGADSEFGFG